MKAFRILVACGVLSAVVTTGGTAVSVSLLVEEQSLMAGPLEKQAKPVTPENPVPRRTNYEPTSYPADAQPTGARGSVTVMITLDETGRVAEARVSRTSLTLQDPAVSMELTEASASDEAKFIINQSVEQSNAVRAVARSFRDAALQSVQQWRYDPPASAPIAFPVTVNFAPPVAPGAAQQETTSRTFTEALQAGDPPVRVGGNIRTPTKIRNVSPVYPAEAQAARVSGMVIIEAIIGTDGRVTDARVLRSIPMLDEAAMEAVRQWEFTPTLLNGAPVRVIMTVTVNFTLA